MLWAALLLGQTQIDPPVTAPPDFSGASGFYRMTTSALPVELHVEDPLILVVTITGDGPKKYWPARKKLKVVGEELRDDFYVKELASRDRHYPGRKMWKFYYVLRPKSESVNDIPGLRFVYWYPQRKKFQTSYSEPIELKVTPRPKVEIPKKAVQQIHVPKSILQLADGANMLRRESVASRPHGLVIAMVLVVPPVLCGLWLWWRRRSYADLLKLHRRRKSRAAQQAFKQLQTNRDHAEEIVGILSQYLAHRIDVTIHEISAADIANRLSQIGAEKELRNRFISFWHRCDALRFSPENEKNAAPLQSEARQLIQDLEDDPCFDVA